MASKSSGCWAPGLVSDKLSREVGWEGDGCAGERGVCSCVLLDDTEERLSCGLSLLRAALTQLRQPVLSVGEADGCRMLACAGVLCSEGVVSSEGGVSCEGVACCEDVVCCDDGVCCESIPKAGFVVIAGIGSAAIDFGASSES